MSVSGGDGDGGDLELHPRLAADTLHVTDLALCRVLLMNDSRYPWLILVPRRAEIAEIHELSVSDQGLLMAEISNSSETLAARFRPDKINVGALGNIVPQLHVHVIARRQSDSAWPGPVWGVGDAETYEMGQAQSLATELVQLLSD